MDEAKRKRLEAAGWVAGSVAEFLNLSPEEAAVIEAAMARRAAEADYDRFFAGSMGEGMTATEAIGFNEISERVKSAKRQFDEAVDALMEAQTDRPSSRLTSKVGILDGDPMYAEAVEIMKENRKRDTYPEAPNTPEGG